MRLEPPSWWYGSRLADRAKAAALLPAAWCYGVVAQARFTFARPYRPPLPVICVGNFTVGGAGKTPLAIEIARLARDWGCKPAFLTRGFGGQIIGPHRVDINRDTAANVGDEALLLARVAPTFVAQDRPRGARAIEASGADVIIMDDGFQNPSLIKDLSIVAIDGGVGLGNGYVMPAGPLRAPLKAQLRRADAVVAIGGDQKISLPPAIGKHGGVKIVPVLRAQFQPAGDCAWLKMAPVVAFCGIGRPAKFFRTLEELGATVAVALPFPDHHMFTDDDAVALLDAAAQASANLVTTEKDLVRLAAGQGPLSELKAKTRALAVNLAFGSDDQPRLASLLVQALGRAGNG